MGTAAHADKSAKKTLTVSAKGGHKQNQDLCVPADDGTGDRQGLWVTTQPTFWTPCRKWDLRGSVMPAQGCGCCHRRPPIAQRRRAGSPVFGLYQLHMGPGFSTALKPAVCLPGPRLSSWHSDFTPARPAAWPWFQGGPLWGRAVCGLSFENQEGIAVCGQDRQADRSRPPHFLTRWG